MENKGIQKVMRSGELAKAGRCAKRRRFANLVTKSAGSDFLDRVRAEKDIVMDALYGGWGSDEVYDAVLEAYDGLRFPTDETRVRQAEIMAKCISRYVNSEDRAPLPQKAVRELELQFDELSNDVAVRPDLVFWDPAARELELVKIKTGKPKLSQSGGKADGSAERSLEHYAMFCYGRAILPDATVAAVKASYFYLKKKSDRFSGRDPHFDPSFFAGDTSNVVSIQDVVAKRADGTYAASQVDADFAPQLAEFDTGTTECTEEMCASCDFDAICNYKLPPVHKDKEARKSKQLSDIELTPAQEKAVAFTEGVARCNAGAGAGKTLVVALRVVNLIMNGADPAGILLLTFTNNGAAEMTERIQAYLKDFGFDEEAGAKIISTTFNAFCNDIVMQEYERLGFARMPRLIDDVERTAIVAKVADRHHIDGLDYRNFDSDVVRGSGLSVVTKAFDIIKSKSLSKGDEDILIDKMRDCGMLQYVSLTGIPQLFDAYSEYDAMMRQECLIEYADQELLFFDLLHQDPYYLEQFGFEHVIVDEFQDSNELQLDLIAQLRDCPAFKSLMVVGDDSQAIFSFRETSPEYIIHFFDQLGVEEEDRHDFFLLENHRCTPQIINAANAINALNTEKVDKDLVATRPDGRAVDVQGFHGKEAEQKAVADGIEAHIKAGTRPEDIAYIAADRYMLLSMGDELTRRGIEWVSLNPEPVLDNSKVVAGIALAKAIDDPQATQCVLTYLNARLGNTLLGMPEEDILDAAGEAQRELEAVSALPDKKRLAKFIELLEELDDDEDELFENAFVEVMKYRRSFKDLLEYVRAMELYGRKMTYKREKDYPGVVLTTAHSSKGLEWPVVYFSLTKFDMPMYHTRVRTGTGLERLEERRRLVFVSMTRARDELVVTGQYVAYGRKGDYVYNQFLKEVYDVLGHAYDPVDHEAEAREAEKKERARKSRAKRLAKKRAERAGERQPGSRESLDALMAAADAAEPKPARKQKAPEQAEAAEGGKAEAGARGAGYAARRAIRPARFETAAMPRLMARHARGRASAGRRLSRRGAAMPW